MNRRLDWRGKANRNAGLSLRLEWVGNTRVLTIGGEPKGAFTSHVRWVLDDNYWDAAGHRIGAA